MYINSLLDIKVTVKHIICVVPKFPHPRHVFDLLNSK